ncbi:hypothetical protein NMG60_11002388 [Bertholletia excelsa]
MHSSDHFPPDFQNYLNEEKYLCKEEHCWRGIYRIFQAEGQLLTIDWEIEGKIKKVIRKSSNIGPWNTLLQFWKAVKIGEDRYLLTTRQQPFSICGENCAGLYGYRRACGNDEYYVDNEVEEEGRLGIPGRVLKYKSFEFTPKVFHYTIQEYPQLDEARRYCIREILAFPVLERSNKQCVGVFELISTKSALLSTGKFLINHFELVLKESGLGIPCQHVTCPQGSVGCNGIFAICLQCNHSDNVLVLEISFNYYGDVYTELYQILKEMKKHLPSFRDSFGQELGEKLPILHIPEERAQRQHPPSYAAITGNNDVGQSNIPNPYPRKEGGIKEPVRQSRKSGIPISLEVIKQQFGKKLDDAAESIGVSRSTLKRACREYKIFWWQSGKRKKDNSSTLCGAPIEKVTQDHVPDVTMPSSSKQPYEPPVAPSTSRMQHSRPLETVSNVNVNVSSFVEEVTQQISRSTQYPHNDGQQELDLAISSLSEISKFMNENLGGEHG